MTPQSPPNLSSSTSFLSLITSTSPPSLPRLYVQANITRGEGGGLLYGSGRAWRGRNVVGKKRARSVAKKTLTNGAVHCESTPLGKRVYTPMSKTSFERSKFRRNFFSPRRLVDYYPVISLPRLLSLLPFSEFFCAFGLFLQQTIIDKPSLRS